MTAVNGRPFSAFLDQWAQNRVLASGLSVTAPAIAPRESATWQKPIAVRLSDGPDELTIARSGDGLLHMHYRTAGGYRVRQVCTFAWFVERLLAGGLQLITRAP